MIYEHLYKRQDILEKLKFYPSNASSHMQNNCRVNGKIRKMILFGRINVSIFPINLRTQ